MSLLKGRWKRLIGLGIIWFIVMFPIPLLPFLDIELPAESIQAIIIILVVITIPFSLLLIFMK